MFGNKLNKTSTPSALQKKPGQSFFTGYRQIPQGVMARKDFDQYLMTNFGVKDIHTGKKDEQENSLSPVQSLPNWSSWDPGSSSDVYSSIIKGFEDLAANLLAIPPVDTIIFYEVDYDPGPNNVGIPNKDVGASFKTRSMNIFRHVTSSRAFPNAKSNAQGTYPTAPGAAIVSSPGSKGGAPAPYTSPAQSVSENIVHELGHGIYDTAMATDPNAFLNFMAAAGWVMVNGKPVLYDIQEPQVQAAIKKGNTPPSQFVIDAMSWNDPKWMEQPMSFYSVDAGPYEDFPETITAFIYSPAVLSQRSPGRYNFIANNIYTWSLKMKQMPPIVPRPPVGDFPMTDEMKHSA